MGRKHMPKVEFFYYADCPSHEQALELLRAVMEEERIKASVEIIEVKTEDDAQQYGFYGSPTICVDGVDIAPLSEYLTKPSLTCRVYRQPDGRISPLPSRALIAAAFHRVSNG